MLKSDNRRRSCNGEMFGGVSRKNKIYKSVPTLKEIKKNGYFLVEQETNEKNKKFRTGIRKIVKKLTWIKEWKNTIKSDKDVSGNSSFIESEKKIKKPKPKLKYIEPLMYLKSKKPMPKFLTKKVPD